MGAEGDEDCIGDDGALLDAWEAAFMCDLGDALHVDTEGPSSVALLSWLSLSLAAWPL